MKKYKYITDPLYGGITIKDELINELIKTREFQRLGRIKHLGVSDFIYPAATHTRLSHSLGVYHLASEVLEIINPEVKLSTKRALLAAALLHDIGHGPFSHNFEKVSKINHEELTIKIIETPGTEVFEAFERIDKDAREETIKMILGKHELNWTNKLISSEIDLDRLDYLNRDTLFTGTKHGYSDWQYILKSMKIIDNQIVYDYKALPSLEAMLIGRFHMNEAVYHNYRNESHSQLLIFFFTRLKQLNDKEELCCDFKSAFEKVNKAIKTDEFQYMDDSFILNLFSKSKKHDDKILNKISDTFLNRKPIEIISKENLSDWESKQNPETKGTLWNIVEIKKDWKFYDTGSDSEFIVELPNGEIKKGSEISNIIQNIGKQKHLHKNWKIGVIIK